MNFLFKRPWIITTSLAVFILLVFFVFSADVSRAQDWGAWREYVPGGIHGNLQDYIKAIIDAALLLAAVVAVSYLIIGGYKYITSSGNAEAVETAKSTILNAIIGLIIIFASYIIIDFVYGVITEGSSGSGGIVEDAVEDISGGEADAPDNGSGEEPGTEG